MTAAVYLVVYFGVLAFVAGCAARAAMYARLPAHLRWELYPVPHEERERAAHGGSYYEKGEWWTFPRGRSMAGQVRFMVTEMLFLKGLRDFNRPLWWRSFPFHFGLYLLAGSLALLVVSVLARGMIPQPFDGGLRFLYRASGFGGWLLALVGATALLHRRLTDSGLRQYTTPGDVFNLAAFIGVLAALGAGYVDARSAGVGVSDVAYGLLTFQAGRSVPPLLGGGLVMGALLIAYIPATHMSHFIAKYFTYHSVRWDDRPMADGRRLQARFAEYLSYRPTWSAPHVRADGTRTWAEIAKSDPGGAPK